MRHLPVIGLHGNAVGMITRKDLMQFLLTDQTAKELILIRRVQRQARIFLANIKKKKALMVKDPISTSSTVLVS